MDIQPENIEPEETVGEITENSEALTAETVSEELPLESFGSDIEEEPPAPSSNFQDYLLLFSIASTVVALDQLTKWLVRVNVPYSRSWNLFPDLQPIFRVVHWRNTGAAFGLFEDGNVVFTILAVVVSLAIIYYYPQVPREDWAVRIALGLQMGGALGNFTDRIFRGFVTDWASFWNFPVFNVADASISIGVVFLIVGMWLAEEEKEEESGLEADLSDEGERFDGENLELPPPRSEDEVDAPPAVDDFEAAGPGEPPPLGEELP